MTEVNEPRLVKPTEILAKVQGTASLGKLADKIQRKVDPPGTPDGKFRLGFVVSFDPTTWTVTALIGDQLTQVAGIPVLAGVVPVAECAAYFGQVSGQSTTEYTLIGMLSKGPGNIRIRKPAFQNISNTGPTMNPDTDLKFQGLAGRTYLYEAGLIVVQNTTVDMDVIVGWFLPTGATWSGGGLGPTLGITLGSTESNNFGANWRGFSNTVGGMRFGVEPAAVNGTFGSNAVFIQIHGTIKMGSTSGLCTVGWSQNVPASASTRVLEGSFLKVDMTSEYTL